MRYALIFTLLATPIAASDKHSDFYGTWGTPSQCAKAPIIEGGTYLDEPFVIGPDWLKHGPVYCSLSWGPMAKRKDGPFTIATAKCGEDSVRGYTLGLRLKSEALELTWDFFLRNGPLQRCPTS